MSYEAKILCDSIAYPWENRPNDGVRLVTLQVTMPRIVLAEFNTHRMLSRNSASSRAIPVERRIAMLESDPFIPDAFLANQKGMQAGEELDYIAQQRAKTIWLQASKAAIKYAKELAQLGVHKQWANRLLEPFAWQTVICSSTEWVNFFNLRRHKDAQPEIHRVADLMWDAMDKHTPNRIDDGGWHIPFITEEDINESCNNPTCTVDDWWLVKLAVARCARVSYLTHDTNKRDTVADVKLHDRLQASGHMSPFEHAAQFVDERDVEDITPWLSSNFQYPWKQYRKFLRGEAIFTGENNG